MERSKRGAIPKKRSDHFVKNVLLLNIGDYHRVRGQVCMPTKSEMDTIRARRGQFKKDVEFHARMTEDMVKKKLEEVFPSLKDKGCFCAAKVNLDNDSSRFDFHGTQHLWDGRTIRSKIQGNSTLYILEDDQMDTRGISGSDPESTQEKLFALIPMLQDHFEVSICPKESPLEGGALCRFTFNPKLPQEVRSGRATFENLRTVQLERVSNGLLGTIPASPVPGLVTVTLESQRGICLGQAYLRYYGMEEVVRKIVFSPDHKRTFEDLMDMYCGLGVTSEKTQSSGILGFTEPVQLLSLLVYTAAKLGAQQFIEIIFNTSSGRVVFDAYKERSSLPEVVARDHGNEETARYLEGITKRFSAEIRAGQECSKTIDWSELVEAAEAAQKQLKVKDICPSLGSEEEIKQVMDSFLLNISGISDLTEAEKQQERKDLEDLKVKTRKAISKMSVTVKSHRAAANYLDEVWRNYSKVRVVGYTGGVTGGLLTIAGGIALLASAGVATPFLLAGVGLGVAGAGTNVAASLSEAAINSSEIKKAEKDLQDTSDSINEVKATVEKWLVEKEKTGLSYIYHLAGQTLTLSDPAVIAILQKEVLPSLELETHELKSAKGSEARWAQAETVATEAAVGGLKKEALVGATLMASKLIVGAGAVCLWWDAKNLQYTIQEIVKDKGSDAARYLRQRADKLESALDII